MRIFLGLAAVALLTACGGGEDAPAMDEAPATEPAAVTMADFAGTWQNTAMLEGTPDPVSTTLSGSDDGMEWTMTLEGRDPVAMTASMSGDSLVLVSEPYESILRDGVTVTVRTAGTLVDGRMIGSLVATYTTPDGEEVVRGTIEGTRGGM
jgi:hypothetical protein